MRLPSRLAEKPEFLHRPAILARRLWFPLLRAVAPLRITRLPWGAPLHISLREHIGRSIYLLGLYELPVAEALWRLADPGETALDIGANIGQMTSVLATRVGPTGRVHSFEPHPVVAQRLRANMALWHARLGWTHVEHHAVALTDHKGQAELVESDEFAANQGTASMEPAADHAGRAVARHTVACRRLDEVVAEANIAAPGVAKLDVEGHELKVLEGADGLLARGAPRDIVYEEQQSYPAPVSKLLEGRGYTLFTFERGPWSPHIDRPTAAHRQRVAWEWTTYVATRDPARFEQRMEPRQWRVLTGR